jgi:alpha-galactosidase
VGQAVNRDQENRRALLRGIGTTMIASALPISLEAKTTAVDSKRQPASSFQNILRAPDAVTAYADATRMSLQRVGSRWQNEQIELQTAEAPTTLQVELTAPTASLSRLHLRWHGSVPEDVQILGDQWERSYGDLSWRSIVPERPLPWYFLAFDGKRTHGYGVKVGARALAFWQCDDDGISLWLDVRNGGRGVKLGERKLEVASIVCREGTEGETPFAAARAFCRQMCPVSRSLKQPLFGSNDWYYAYGKNSAKGILRDAELVAELAPQSSTRPFTVIDDGWQNKLLFPDMAELAANIRRLGVRPGIWIRPLQASLDTDPRLLLPAARFGSKKDRQTSVAFDPTIPEARDMAVAKMREAVAWGYDLVKHDFSTFELMGQWGNEMGASPAFPGWSFHDESKTTAEVILDFYSALRDAAGETIVIGCNTMGHLGAGLFEAQRTGDDTSGRIWERTRRMGVNTLAFRLPQHQTFFTMDADCVAITPDVPWRLTESWLNVVAHSGTALLVSADPSSTGKEQKQSIRSAFTLSANGNEGFVPTDWLETPTPQVWQQSPQTHHYNWLDSSGAWPFEV